MKNQNKLHYAWVIVITCILLKLGLGGAVYCIAGNFVTPVVRDLGCSVSQFTMMVSVEAAAMAVLYTTAARVINTKKIGLVMGAAALAEVIAIALMGTYNSVWMFYLSGAIVGIGVAFTGFVAIPIVVNMWFKKKAGTVLGAIVACESVSTILFTLLTAELIDNFGWRKSYFIMAAIALVISVPAAFLFLKSPEEAGCKPYGTEEEDTSAKAAPEWGIERRKAVKMPLFYIVWGTCMLYSIGCGVQQYIATFATMELGQTISFGATAAMCMSIGCVFSSMILGAINDKFGVKVGLGYGAACIVLGYGCMIFSLHNPILCVPAALVVGLGGSMYTVQCPLIARTALGGKDYSAIWSLMMTGNSMVGAFTFSSIGLFYDKDGSYFGAFVMAIGLYCVAFVVGSIAINIGKKYREQAI